MAQYSYRPLSSMVVLVLWQYASLGKLCGNLRVSPRCAWNRYGYRISDLGGAWHHAHTKIFLSLIWQVFKAAGAARCSNWYKALLSNGQRYSSPTILPFYQQLWLSAVEISSWIYWNSESVPIANMSPCLPLIGSEHKYWTCHYSLPGCSACFWQTWGCWGKSDECAGAWVSQWRGTCAWADQHRWDNQLHWLWAIAGVSGVCTQTIWKWSSNWSVHVWTMHTYIALLIGYHIDNYRRVP